MHYKVILLCAGVFIVNFSYGNISDAKRYEPECLRGNAMACNAAGTVYVHDGDPKRGIELLNKACDFGDLDGCGSLSEIYFKGQIVSKDINKANIFLQKYIDIARQKCDKNDAQMCYGMGNMYATGFIKNNVIFIKQDKSKASSYFKKSCKLGYEDSCSSYALLNNIPYNEPIHISPLAEEKP